MLANSYQGEPLDCIGGVINDLSADGKGGVYFTMGGVYYADPKGVVTKYGEGVTPNGIVLSADEKTLYVTNGPAIAAFDVQPNGSLTNQREFGKLEGPGGGDGLTIDSDGPPLRHEQPGRAGPRVPTASTSARSLRRAASSPAPSAARTRRRSSSSRAARRPLTGPRSPTRRRSGRFRWSRRATRGARSRGGSRPAFGRSPARWIRHSGIWILTLQSVVTLQRRPYFE